MIGIVNISKTLLLTLNKSLFKETSDKNICILDIGSLNSERSYPKGLNVIKLKNFGKMLNKKVPLPSFKKIKKNKILKERINIYYKNLLLNLGKIKSLNKKIEDIRVDRDYITYDLKKLDKYLQNNIRDYKILYVVDLFPVDNYFYELDFPLNYISSLFKIIQNKKIMVFTVRSKINTLNYEIIPKLREELSKHELYLNGMFSMNNYKSKKSGNDIHSVINQYSSFEPMQNFILIISKNKTKKFVYNDALGYHDYIPSGFNTIRENLEQHLSIFADNVVSLLKKNSSYSKETLFFKNFDYTKILLEIIKNKIDLLEKDFINYKTYKVKDFCLKTIALKKSDQLLQLKNFSNVLFLNPTPIPETLHKFRDLVTVTKRVEFTEKFNRNLIYALVLDNKLILDDYLYQYFNSELGRLKFGIINFKMYPIVSNMYKEEFENITIMLPSINEQKSILYRLDQLNKVKKNISKISQNILDNPISSKEDVEKIELIYKNTEDLNDIDRVRSIIKRKETLDLEFKKTLGYEPDTKKHEKYLEDAAFKEIVSFLNGIGGDLLIGVKDTGEVLGIQEEIDKFYTKKGKDSEDLFIKHIDDLIVSKIGIDFSDFIKPKIVKYEKNKLLCWINCLPGKKMASLKDIKGNITIYRRTNSSARPVTNPHEIIKFEKERFPDSSKK